MKSNKILRSFYGFVGRICLIMVVINIMFNKGCYRLLQNTISV